MSRNYWTLFTAASVSNVGDGVLLGALPLLAAGLSRDPLAISAVTAFTWLPWLLFSLPAGVIVDRVDRRRLMVGMDTVRALVVGALAAVVALGNPGLSLIFAIAFALGTAETLFDNAAQTILPSLVPTGELARANGLLFAAEVTSNRFIGPPLGGALFVAASSAPFALDAVSFVVSGALLAALAGSFRATALGDHLGLRAEVVEGLAWLWRHQVIRSFAVGAAAINVAFTAGYSLLVLQAVEVFGVGEVGFGILLAALAVGSIFGSLVASRLVKAVGERVAVVASVAAMGVAMLSLAAWQAPIAVGALLALVGFAQMVWNVVAVSYRQAVVPDALLGRVNSAYRLVAFGSFPIGALLGGAVAGWHGLVAPWAFGGAGTLLLAPLLAMSLRRM